jgi:acylglycerol lipase
MQMETADLGKLESPEIPPDQAKKPNSKDNQLPPLDVAPVISWVDPGVALKAVLVCVHGLGLNKSSYEAFGEQMAKKGYGVYAMDVRGFGEFQQLPGDRRCNFQKCLDDVSSALRLTRKLHPGVAVFVLGESMGGAIAMRVTEEHPELMDGLISSVPGANRHNQWSSRFQVGMKIITGGTSAKVNVGKSVVNQSTEKEELRQKWLQDKMARFELTAAELIQFQHFMEANKKYADKITRTPVLMLQGQKDRLVTQEDDSGENFSTYKRIKSECSLVMIDHAEHLVFEEGQFEEKDLQMVSAWIDAHIPSTLKTSQSGSPASTQQQ